MAGELEGRINEILSSGRVIYSGHAKKQMAKRGYSIGDVHYILHVGTIKKYTEKGKERYECEIHGKDLENDDGAVIILIIKDIRLIIKTVLGGV